MEDKLRYFLNGRQAQFVCKCKTIFNRRTLFQKHCCVGCESVCSGVIRKKSTQTLQTLFACYHDQFFCCYSKQKMRYCQVQQSPSPSFSWWAELALFSFNPANRPASHPSGILEK
jgi:hypothetical protein